MSEVILKVDNLATSFQTEMGTARAVDEVSFELHAGKTLGIVGESGCGKSVTSFSIMRLLPQPAGKIEQGSILFDGMDLATVPAEKMHAVRGNKISMIFQEPMSALNPVIRVGEQIAEAFRLHRRDLSKADIFKRSMEMMEKVGIPAVSQRYYQFPHQLSGGMRQRVVIAIALACEPQILIADEPTTALDVTIQAQILDLMRSLQKENGMSIIFITHDLGVIAEMSDEVLVMYGGRTVEQCDVRTLFRQPQHPYTMGLLASLPRLDAPRKVKLPTIEGMVPSLFDMPSGCRFQNRCPYVKEVCKTTVPELEHVEEGHFVRCCRRSEING